MRSAWRGRAAGLFAVNVAVLGLSLNAAGPLSSAYAHSPALDEQSAASSLAGADAVEPWVVEPITVIRARPVGYLRDGERVVGPRGTRVWSASSLSDHGIPSAALRAYKNAAQTMAEQDPGCQIPWTLLAGIGRVESDHGRYGGSVLARDGVSRPLIIGIALNGKGPVAAVHDTDHGRLDKDTVWDRAVGPMQFIPSTWAGIARDGDGDGVKTPNDIDDAALGAAAYLCSGSGSIRSGSAMAAAIYRYNPSDYYVALVSAFEAGYRTGVFSMPPPPAAEPAATGHKHRAARARSDSATRAPRSIQRTRRVAAPTTSGTPSSSPAPKASTTPKPKPAPTPKPSPSPSPTPKPSPSPTPTPTLTLATLSGALSSCGPGCWTVDGTTLDLGGAARESGTAAHDYDGDGAVETLGDELTGLAQGTVNLQVKAGTGVVYVINALDYRFKDGNFA